MDYYGTIRDKKADLRHYKYIRRYRKNGEWRYVYKSDTKSNNTPKKNTAQQQMTSIYEQQWDKRRVMPTIEELRKKDEVTVNNAIYTIDEDRIKRGSTAVKEFLASREKKKKVTSRKRKTDTKKRKRTGVTTSGQMLGYAQNRADR